MTISITKMKHLLAIKLFLEIGIQPESLPKLTETGVAELWFITSLYELKMQTPATSPNYSEQSLENASSAHPAARDKLCCLRNRALGFRVTVMLRTVLCPSGRPWDCWYDACGKRADCPLPKFIGPSTVQSAPGKRLPRQGCYMVPWWVRRCWWHPGDRDVVKHCLCLLPTC